MRRDISHERGTDLSVLSQLFCPVMGSPIDSPVYDI